MIDPFQKIEQEIQKSRGTVLTVTRNWEKYYVFNGDLVCREASHPYFYCVIPARPGFGLEAFAGKKRGGKGIVVEFQQDAKAEVLVFRQYTTKNSGYSTNLNVSRSILEITLQAARRILEER